MPTPMISGGQGLPPDSSTVRRTNSMIASLPARGRKLAKRLMFSQPPPLGSTLRCSWSPGTMSQWMTAGVLLPEFRRL